jgi:flagellar biosynthesis protein FlhG
MNLPHDQASTLRLLSGQKKEGQRNDPLPVKSPKILALASGKGGTGKTVLSVNLAFQFQRMGLKVLLVDVDPGLANIDVHLRLQAKKTTRDLIEGKCSAEETVLIGPNGLWIVPGGNMGTHHGDSDESPSTADPYNPKAMDKLLQALRPLLSKIDLVLLDTGAGIGPWVLRAVEHADQTLIVTQSDPASVTDAYAFLKLARRRRPDRSPALIVNRVSDKREALLTASRLRKVAKRFLSFEPELAGWLHEDERIDLSVKNQVPLSLALETQDSLYLDLAGCAAKCRALFSRPTKPFEQNLPNTPPKKPAGILFK